MERKKKLCNYKGLHFAIDMEGFLAERDQPLSGMLD